MSKKMPNKIKELTLAFDVSTSKTGYAILADKQPILLKNNKPSYGFVEMIENVPGLKKKINYDSYGDKMTFGTMTSMRKLTSIVYDICETIANHKMQNPNFDIEKITVVFEVSEIPNMSNKQDKYKNKNFQTLTSVRKLGLFTGMVVGRVWDTINLLMFHFMKKIQVKLIKPQEWQLRRGFKKSPLNYKEENKKYGMKFSKFQSLEAANKIIVEEWKGQPIDNDDTADAINIALVATEVRDNVFASAQANTKQKNIKYLESDIAKLEAKISEYQGKALTRKNEIIDRVLWVKTAKYEELKVSEKALYTKYSKYNLDDVRNSTLKEFLTPDQQKKSKKWVMELKNKKEEIVKLRGENVIK